MSSFLSSVRSHQLAIGAALLGCSLASTESSATPPPPLNFTTVNSLTVSMTAGAASLSYTLPAASNGFVYNNNAGGVDRIVGGIAYGGPTSDLIAIALITGSNQYTSGTGSGTISLTFSADMTFTDLGLLATGYSSGWEYGGSAVTNGQLFTASGGPYVFTINYAYSGAATNSFISYGFFTLAAPAVPLPGAAGLAACGLLGLSRRRRR